MDELQNYLSHIDLGQVNISQLLPRVQGALEECTEDDPRLPLLMAVEGDLLESQWPQARLQRFADRYPPVIKADLEGEFRQLAESLPAHDWKTSAYTEVTDRLTQFESDDDGDGLLDFLEDRQQKLELALSSYAKTPLLPQEVTFETVVGHRLLSEGMQNWLAGINLLIESAQSGTSWEVGLLQAEHGNRLLIAVQRLNQRVGAQIARQSF